MVASAAALSPSALSPAERRPAIEIAIAPTPDPTVMMNTAPLTRRTPSPTFEGRDLFAFGVRPAPRQAIRRGSPSAPSARTPDADSGPSSEVEEFALPTLVGIAAEPRAQGLHRTAVVMDGETMRFAQEGEMADRRHRIVRILADRMEIRNTETTATTMLILR